MSEDKAILRIEGQQQQPLVIKRMANLSNEIDRLTEIYGVLSGRLVPVLEPELEKTSSETAVDKIPTPEQPCRIAGDLEHFIRRVNELGQAIQELLNRLQI